MSPSDENLELLRRWYRRLDPQRALDLTREGGDDSELYVALDAWEFETKVHSLRGPAAVSSILRNIRISAHDFEAKSTHLFAGFRGTGKTTELSRLTRDLRATGGFSVLQVSARDYHHLSDSLSIEELAVLLVAGIGEAALEVLGEDQLPGLAKVGVWSRITELLGGIFKDSGLSLRFGPVELKPALRQGEGLKVDLRAALRDRPHRLQEFLHGFVAEIAGAIAPRRLVVLVDDLEKYDVPGDRVVDVYQEMADLFFHSAEILKLPNCHVIYTVPPYLAFANRAIANAYDGRLHILPSIRVRARPPEHSPFEPGLAAMHALIAERIDLDRLFGGERDVCVRRLVLGSGGNLRDLFNMLRDVVELALDADLPVGTDEVDMTIERHAAHRTLMLVQDEFELLVDVSAHGDLSKIRHDRRGAFAQAMDQQLLLAYWNGSIWYDTHPLVEPELRRYLAASGEES